MQKRIILLIIILVFLVASDLKTAVATPSVSLSETAGISDIFVASVTSSPEIISITASDPDGGADTGFSNGDIIIVIFSEPTNKPFAGTLNQLTKANLDALFTSSQSLGTDYTGTYPSPSTLVITIQDSTGATPPTVGGLTLTVKASGNLRNAIGFSSPSTSVSPVLVGDFGARAGPFITDLVADDPNGGTDIGFSVGDTITVRFSEPTNQPPAATKSDLDTLFTFMPSLGTADYTGTYTNPSTLVITIADTGNANPVIGAFALGVNAAANLKNTAGTSNPSTFTSPALSGKFETFFALPHVNVAGDTVSTTLPSGIVLAMTSQTTGTVTIVRSTASTVGSGGSILEFLAEVLDIIPPPLACDSGSGPGCTFSFTFTDDDLGGLDVSAVKIYHDKNNDSDFADTVDLNSDGDFTDPGEGPETLATTVVPSSPPGPYTATATDFFTSKFAIGGVRALALGGGASGEFSPPSFSSKAFAENEYPLTIDGTGFKLDKYSQTIPTISLETGKPIQMKISLYDPSGPSSIHHLAMYMNLRDLERDIPHSDTFIIYDKSTPTVISDPNGLFGKVTVTPQNVGNKLELTFDVTFAKPMEKSDIIFRMWDDRRNNADTKVFDAIEVTGPEVQASQSILEETVTVQTIEPKQTSIPTWIKDNAGWWKDGQIADSEFVSGIQYLIQNDIITIPETEESDYLSPQPIPVWIKNNAGWWRDGMISDSEFVTAIQWLVSNGIMKIDVS